MATNKIKISHREWELLDKLTSKAKMDWFFDETTNTRRQHYVNGKHRILPPNCG